MSPKDRVYILEIIQLDGTKTQYVNKPSFLIGRGPSSVIKIDDQNISREHVRISFDGSIRIQDLNSSNGTFVNGNRIPALLDFKISETDVIVLGKAALTFKINTFTPHDEVKQFVSPEPKFDIKKKTSKAQEPAIPIAPQITEDTPADYRSKVDDLMAQTKDQMSLLKAETESHLDKKKMSAIQEIEILWKKHQEQVDLEKRNILTDLEAKNKLDLDIERERLRNEMFVEKKKLMTEAESVIEKKNEEHIKRALFYKTQIDKMKSEYEESLEKADKLKDINQKYAIAQKNFDQYKLAEKSAVETAAEVKQLTEKKEILNNLILELTKNLSESKIKAKNEVESEFKNLREIETKKFEELKAAGIKELEKIRFNYENAFIAIKDSNEEGDEGDQLEKLENWKKRQKLLRSGIFMAGAMAALLLYFSGHFLYSILPSDSPQQDSRRIAEQSPQTEIESHFTVEKTDQLFDSYVESAIYTKNYTEVYLDETLQKEWAKKATFYFLYNWKVDEQKMIQVLARSNSLVQNIRAASKKFTKSQLNSEIDKLNELENQNTKLQASILGTNLKYEAFKKFEKKFFAEKLQKRSTASQPTGQK